MTVLVGKGNPSGAGHAFPPILATAAVIGDNKGRFTLSPAILEAVARQMRRGEGPLDIVLFVHDALYGLLLRLPDQCNMVGVVAEREMRFAPPGNNLAIVCGVTGALTAVRDGDWVIVDPAKGRVVINPAAEEIARLQAPRKFRPSYLIGANNVPAVTQSGRTIPVWAAVRDFADIGSAVQNGADGILIEDGGELLLDMDSDCEDDADEMMFAGLSQAADSIGGGAVGIVGGMDSVHPRTIVRLASVCHLSWIFRPEAISYPISSLIDEMNLLIDEEDEIGRTAALPRIEAYVTGPDVLSPEDLTLLDFDGVVFLRGADPPHRYAFLPPIIRMMLPEGDVDQMTGWAIAQGASTLIVVPSDVEYAKDAIRQVE